MIAGQAGPRRLEVNLESEIAGGRLLQTTPRQNSRLMMWWPQAFLKVTVWTWLWLRPQQPPVMSTPLALPWPRPSHKVFRWLRSRARRLWAWSCRSELVCPSVISLDP